jgi:hypothetical protein
MFAVVEITIREVNRNWLSAPMIAFWTKIGTEADCAGVIGAGGAAMLGRSAACASDGIHATNVIRSDQILKATSSRNKLRSYLVFLGQ